MRHLNFASEASLVLENSGEAAQQEVSLPAPPPDSGFSREGESSFKLAALISYTDHNHRQSLQGSALARILGSLTRICIMVPAQEIFNPQN